MGFHGHDGCTGRLHQDGNGRWVGEYSDRFCQAYIGHPVDSRAVSVLEKANISEFIVYGGYNDMTHVFNGVSVTGTPETDRLDLRHDPLLGPRADL